MKSTESVRVKWTYGDDLNKWVTCLGCYYEYYIESREINSSCLVCGSREYEESKMERDYLSLEELEDLL